MGVRCNVTFTLHLVFFTNFPLPSIPPSNHRATGYQMKPHIILNKMTKNPWI